MYRPTQRQLGHILFNEEEEEKHKNEAKTAYKDARDINLIAVPLEFNIKQTTTVGWKS